MTRSGTAMNTSDSQNLQQKLTQALRSDPKKTGSLAVLFACLAVMGIRLVMPSGGGGPSGARAGTGAAGGLSRNANDSASKVGGLSGFTPGVGQSWRGSGNSAISAAAALQKWSDAPVPPISRNLFAVRIDYFPVDGS